MFYIIGDMGVYFIQKIIRRDFIYWPPLPPTITIPLSILFRVMVKSIVDFSGCLMFRNSLELGGIYFSFNLLMTQVSVFVCVYLYHAHYAGENELDETLTSAVTAGLFALWFAIFVFLIFCVIVPEYRKTFWSFQTGRQMCQSYFLENEGDDATKAIIFATHAAHWKNLEVEVKAWTMANWARWEEEKPEWFDLALKASIPDEYIPIAAIEALGGVGRERRGSASLSVIEAMDLGRRRLSLGGEEKRDDSSESVLRVREAVDTRRQSLG
jgi:hypothetical protein